MNVRGILSSQPFFSPRRIMRGFFCLSWTTHTHIHRIPVTQVVWDYVLSLLPWQPARACSVQQKEQLMMLDQVSGGNRCLYFDTWSHCRVASHVWCFKTQMHVFFSLCFFFVFTTLRGKPQPYFGNTIIGFEVITWRQFFCVQASVFEAWLD